MAEIRIGSQPDNDLVFTEDGVAPYHASIVVDGEQLMLIDHSDAAGTRLDGEPIDRAVVAEGARISLGSHPFTLTAEHLALLSRPQSSRRNLTVQERAIRPGSLELGEPPVAGPKSITLGYDKSNSVIIDAAQVSGHHARITQTNDGFEIVDLHSTNGTFVAGQRISGPTAINPGEKIGLGSHQICFDDEFVAHFRARRGPETLAIDVSQVNWKEPLKRPLSVGRADDNDIVIPAPQVSGYHAELRPLGDGWMLQDIGSLNGTYINSRDATLTPNSEVKVTEKDIVYLGSYRFPMARVLEHARRSRKEQTVELGFDKDLVTIGRGPENDVVIDAPSVSRNHARILRQGNGWVLEDLGSANGTYVDGRRVARCELTGENLIAFGSYVLRIDPSRGLVRKEYQGEIMLRAESITVDVRDRSAPGGVRRILDDVSFTAYPTEFIGILGPSGAGKTTMNMALAGYLPPTQGQSLLNNLDLYHHYNQFRGKIGYVPQDDIIHRELTVYESLYYTAKLRLPPDTSDAEIERLIERTLESLGIAETKHIAIGSPIKKGISGGQRKRVNLAQELLTQPSLLFLDEPTSGLASSDTRGVMQLLRRLADEGRTILLTIHQPSLVAYREMDNVLYLAKGRLMYYGPTFPDSILFFNPEVSAGTPIADEILANPDSAMLPLAADCVAPDAEDLLEARHTSYLSSKHYEDYVAGRRGEKGDVKLTPSRKGRAERRFGLRQWWVLTRRALTIKRKDTVNSAILLLQAPIIGVLIAVVFGMKSMAEGEPIRQFLAQQGHEGIDAAALFMLVASAVWFGTSNSAREIVGELAIYRRERMVNLKIVSYVMSKVTVLGLLSLVQCTILLGIVHPLLGLHGNFRLMLTALFLCSLAGVGIGLMLSALVRTTEAAITLVPLLLIPQIVLGGLIVPLANLEGGARPAVRYATAAMISRWGFESMLHIEQATRPGPPSIGVSEALREQAAKFDLTPETPLRKRGFAGVKFDDPRRVKQLEALFHTRLARALDESQREATLVQRYFGRFASSNTLVVLVLLSINVFLIGLVCLILRSKDTEVM